MTKYTCVSNLYVNNLSTRGGVLVFKQFPIKYILKE